MKKYVKKLSLLAIAMMLMAVIAGCGGKEVVMKEFKSPDETVSIKLDETWNVEDMGVDGWVGASNKSGTDAVVVMQVEKMSSGISDIGEVKSLVEESYNFSNVEEAEKPSMAGVTGIEAYTCKMDLDGTTGEGYVVYGETDYAYYAFVYAANRMNDTKKSNFRTSCASFKENAPEIENNSTVEATDTIQWINATYAILTRANGWDYTIYAGLPANDTSKQIQIQLLDEWWGITDRASADETIEWLITEGHNGGFISDMESLEADGLGEVEPEKRVDYLLSNYEMSEAMAQSYADSYAAYEVNPENTIIAWDYSRVMSVISECYLAGYYTEEEALDLSLTAGVVIQENFDSWESFIESYLIGYVYWAEESSDARRALYEELLAAPDNPYAVDFNLTLEKSW